MTIKSLSIRARVAAVAVAVFGACGAAVAVAAPAHAAATWRYQQLDSDSCWDAVTLDANFNGYAETQWFDVDNDCRWDTALWNSVGGDSFLESLTFDLDENGRWSVWLADNNQRVGFDMVYFDVNEDGYYDGNPVSLAPATSSITTTAALFEAINGNLGVFRTNPSFMNLWNAQLSAGILSS